MSTYRLEGFPTNLVAESVTIASGAAESNAVPTQGMALIGVFMPAAWTAANIGVNAHLAQTGTAYPVYDTSAGAIQKAKVAVSSYIPFPTDAVYGPFISIESVDDAGATVNQEASRTLILVFRRYLS